MSKISGVSLGMLMAMATVVAQPADAVMQSETTLNCSTAYVSIGDGVMVPNTICWTTTYYSNTGDIGGYYDPGNDGSGNVGGELGSSGNSPWNVNAATCKSDSTQRYMHAAQDFGAWKAQNKPRQISGRGEVFTAIYDDGGTEKYMWIIGAIAASTLDPETYLARVPGTLNNCP